MFGNWLIILFNGLFYFVFITSITFFATAWSSGVECLASLGPTLQSMKSQIARYFAFTVKPKIQLN